MDKKTEDEDRGYHHGDLKTALISVAKKLLEEHGPEGMSFREIARQTGVSRTAPYNHFHNKNHLLATVAQEGFQEFTVFLIENHDSKAKPKQKIFELVQAYAIFARSHPQLYRLMFGVGIANWKNYPQTMEAAYKSYMPLKTVVREYYGENRADIFRIEETAALTIWSTFHGLSMLIIDGKLSSGNLSPSSPEETARRVAKWVIAGLDAAADDISLDP